MFALIQCCTLIAGCGTSPPKPSDLPAAIARHESARPIAVVPVAAAPDTKLSVFASDAGSGILRGAQSGAIGGASTVPLLVYSPAPAGILVVPALVIGGLVMGSLWGAFQATSPERASEIAQSIAEALAGYNPSASAAQGFANALAKTGEWQGELRVAAETTQADPSAVHARLAAQGFGAVVEVQSRRITFTQVRGNDPDLALVVTTEARLVDVAAGRTIVTRQASYQSPMRKFAQWTDEGGRRLRAEIEHAQEVLGERLVERLLYGAEWAPIPTWRFEGCGLPHVAPKPERDYLGGGAGGTARVDTPAPRLAWEAFPTPQYLDADATLKQATDVVYDVRVWASDESALRVLVYERVGVAETSVRVEPALAPATVYRWSVRARYTVRDRRYATRWSAAWQPVFVPNRELVTAAASARTDAGEGAESPCARVDAARWSPCACLDFIPPQNYYKFVTP
jgi:hypothetical protein